MAQAAVIWSRVRGIAVRLVVTVLIALAGTLPALMLACPFNAVAQTAHLSGYKVITNISGPSTLYAVAVDGNGNVFGLSLGAGTDIPYVTEWSPSGGGYTSNVVVPGLPGLWASPWGIAVDQGDNLYICAGNALLKETFSAGSYIQSVIAGNVSSQACSLAVDLNGNVYAGNTKYTPSGSGYLSTSIPVYLPSSLPASPAWMASFGEIAVDASGNVYLATEFFRADESVWAQYLVEESPSGGGYIQTNATPLTGPWLNFNGAVVADANGNLYTVEVPAIFSAPAGYAVDTSGHAYIAASALVWKATNYPASSSGGNFGSLAVGSTSFLPGATPFSNTAVESTFTFDSPGTLGYIGVPTGYGIFGGGSSSDFSSFYQSTCNQGTAYAAGQTCTVDVSFTPGTAGIRNGAVYLTDSSSNVLATGYLQGTGVAPLAVMYPGTLSVLFDAASSGLSQPAGLAGDDGGNIYIADTANNQVVGQAGGTGLQVVVANGPSNGLSGPTGVAVDGSGSVLIADTGNNQVVKETLSQVNGLCLHCAHSYTQSVVASGLSQPQGLAADGAGNVYISDTGNNRILLETPAASGYTQTVLIDSGLSNPTGIAVDGSGDLFIANNGAGEVVEETLSGGVYTLSVVASGLNQPQGISLDPAGNVYIADAGNNRILLEQLTGSSYTQTVIASGLNNPQAIVVNQGHNNSNWGMGYEYIADTGNQRVLMLDLFDPQTLNFPNTLVGGVSATQTATLVNIGNAPLQFTVPATGSNPSLVPYGYGNIAADFTLASGGTEDCPAVSAGASEPTTLAAGASCLLPLSFTPIALDPGYINYDEGATLSIADNTLNGNYNILTTQSVLMVGSAVTAVTTALGSSLNPSTYGQTVTFTATETPASGNLVPTGSVQFIVDGSPAGSPTAVAGGIASYATSSLTGGTHSITAMYSPTPGAPFVASTSSVLSQTISGASQTITFPTIPSQIAATTLTLSATASSGLAVSFASTTQSVCTVSGSAASFISYGRCTIQATQAGNADFLAATPVSQTFSVGHASQTINFQPIASQVAGTTINLIATASSGLAVSFGSSSPTICTVSGSTASLIAAGFCYIQAMQPGNNEYLGAMSVLASFGVGHAPQTINFPAITGGHVAATTLGLVATATSGLPVAFASTTPTVCTVSGTTASLIAEGFCTIEATQNGDNAQGNSEYFVANPAFQTFGVGHASQTISFPAIGSKTAASTVNLVATASSGLQVSFASATPAICTVSGTVASLIAEGFCWINASQAGNSEYFAAPTVGQQFGVGHAYQTITYAPSGPLVAATTVNLNPAASSGLPVALVSTTPSVCTISGTSATLLTYGFCGVTASVAGNSEYFSATTATSFGIGHHAQTITFPAIPTQYVGTPLALSATASSGLAVGFASTTTGVCTVSGTTASFIATGTCTIVASQAGNSTYGGALNVSRSFTVAP
jgi:hypothetical protein